MWLILVAIEEYDFSLKTELEKGTLPDKVAYKPNNKLCVMIRLRSNTKFEYI